MKIVNSLWAFGLRTLLRVVLLMLLLIEKLIKMTSSEVERLNLQVRHPSDYRQSRLVSIREADKNNGLLLELVGLAGVLKAAATAICRKLPS